MTTGETKACSKCGRQLPATKEFFYAYGYLSGATLRSVCKACYIKQQEERRSRNRVLREQKKIRPI